MSAEFSELSKRIKAASDSATLNRLERSCERIWNAGFLTPAELSRLDSMIIDRHAKAPPSIVAEMMHKAVQAWANVQGGKP